jgi:hypothetical protein
MGSWLERKWIHKGINPKEGAGEGAAEQLLNQLAAFSQATV